MSYLSLAYKNDYIFILKDQIKYLKAEKAYTWIFLQNGKQYLSSKNLGIFDSKLIGVGEMSSSTFYRIHHGVIINTQYVKKVNLGESSLELVCGQALNISQRKKGAFMKTLKQLSQFV